MASPMKGHLERKSLKAILQRFILGRCRCPTTLGTLYLLMALHHLVCHILGSSNSSSTKSPNRGRSRLVISISTPAPLRGLTGYEGSRTTWCWRRYQIRSGLQDCGQSWRVKPRRGSRGGQPHGAQYNEGAGQAVAAFHGVAIRQVLTVAGSTATGGASAPK